jgi:hypothetical protein
MNEILHCPLDQIQAISLSLCNSTTSQFLNVYLDFCANRILMLFGDPLCVLCESGDMQKEPRGKFPRSLMLEWKRHRIDGGGGQPNASTGFIVEGVPSKRTGAPSCLQTGGWRSPRKVLTMQFIMGNEKKLGAEYLCNVAILQLRKKKPTCKWWWEQGLFTSLVYFWTSFVWD